jgi:hypothetical protein
MQLLVYRTLTTLAAPSLSRLHKQTHHLTYFREKFDDVCQIGEGSFGEVFRARYKETGQYYAVKRSKERFRSDCDRWVNRCTCFIVVINKGLCTRLLCIPSYISVKVIVASIKLHIIGHLVMQCTYFSGRGMHFCCQPFKVWWYNFRSFSWKML